MPQQLPLPIPRLADKVTEQMAQPPANQITPPSLSGGAGLAVGRPQTNVGTAPWNLELTGNDLYDLRPKPTLSVTPPSLERAMSHLGVTGDTTRELWELSGENDPARLEFLLRSTSGLDPDQRANELTMYKQAIESGVTHYKALEEFKNRMNDMGQPHGDAPLPGSQAAVKAIGSFISSNDAIPLLGPISAAARAAGVNVPDFNPISRDMGETIGSFFVPQEPADLVVLGTLVGGRTLARVINGTLTGRGALKEIARELTLEEMIEGTASGFASLGTYRLTGSEEAAFVAGLLGGVGGSLGAGAAIDNVLQGRATGYKPNAGFINPPDYEPIPLDTIEAFMAEVERVRGGVDMNNIVKGMGKELYNGYLDQITIKEGLQNAVDSMRPLNGGRLRVEYDSKARSILIEDSGVGMSPDIARSEFINIGGTAKAEGASGGFGWAKVAIFSNAENVKVRTTTYDGRQYVTTTVEGSGEDWLNEGFKYTTSRSDTGTTGTRMEIVMREDSKRDSWFTRTWMQTFINRNRFGPSFEISGAIDGMDIDRSGETFTHAEKLTVRGANADVWLNDATRPATSVRVHILNNGLYQFTKNAWFGNDPLVLPADVTIDVHPESEIGSGDYPFDPSREKLRAEIDKAIDNWVNNVLQMRANEVRAKELREAFEKRLPAGYAGSKPLSVIDLSGQLDAAFLGQMASRPYLRNIGTKIMEYYPSIQRDVERIAHGFPVNNSEFIGWSTGPGHQAVHVYAKTIYGMESDVPDAVLINPYIIMRTLFDILPDTMTADWNTVRTRLSRSIAAAMSHEAVHSVSAKHEETFSYWLTMIMGSGQTDMERVVNAIKSKLTKEDIDLWLADYAEYEIQTAALGDPKANILGSASDDLQARESLGDSRTGTLDGFLRAGLEERVLRTGQSVREVSGEVLAPTSAKYQPRRSFEPPDHIEESTRRNAERIFDTTGAYPPGDPPELGAITRDTAGAKHLGNAALGDYARLLDLGHGELMAEMAYRYKPGERQMQSEADYRLASAGFSLEERFPGITDSEFRAGDEKPYDPENPPLHDMDDFVKRSKAASSRRNESLSTKSTRSIYEELEEVGREVDYSKDLIDIAAKGSDEDALIKARGYLLSWSREETRLLNELKRRGEIPGDVMSEMAGALSTTGNPELDRAIIEWVKGDDATLPANWFETDDFGNAVGPPNPPPPGAPSMTPAPLGGAGSKNRYLGGRRLMETTQRWLREYFGGIKDHDNELWSWQRSWHRRLNNDKAAKGVWDGWKKQGLNPASVVGKIIEGDTLGDAPYAIRKYIVELRDALRDHEAMLIAHDPKFKSRMLFRKVDIGQGPTTQEIIDPRYPTEEGTPDYDAIEFETIELTEYFPSLFKAPPDGWNRFFSRALSSTRSEPGRREFYERRRTRVIDDPDGTVRFAIEGEEGRPARFADWVDGIKDGTETIKLEPLSEDPMDLVALRIHAGWVRVQKDILLKRALNSGWAQERRVNSRTRDALKGNLWEVDAPEGWDSSQRWEVPKVAGLMWTQLGHTGYDVGIAFPRPIAALLNDAFDVNRGALLRRTMEAPTRFVWLAKLINFTLSLFQHADLALFRPLGVKVARARRGSPQELVKFPFVFADGLASAFVPKWRNHSRELWTSDPRLRLLVQRGLNSTATQDFVSREVKEAIHGMTTVPFIGGLANSSVGPIALPVKAANAFLRYFSEGLFEGLYGTVARHIAQDFWAMTAKAHPDWTDEQIADVVAPNTNLLISSIDNYESVLRNEGMRDIMRVTLTSFTEQEFALRSFIRGIGGIIDNFDTISTERVFQNRPSDIVMAPARLAARTARAPLSLAAKGVAAATPEPVKQARDSWIGGTGRTAEGKAASNIWADIWIGHTAALFLFAQVINYAATGELLDPTQYSPVRFTEEGPKFNSKFLRPVIGFTELGQPIFFDLWGQLDTPFRWLTDPTKTFENRLSPATRFFFNMARNHGYDQMPYSTEKNRYYNMAERAFKSGIEAFQPILIPNAREGLKFDNPLYAVPNTLGFNAYASGISDLENHEAGQRWVVVNGNVLARGIAEEQGLFDKVLGAIGLEEHIRPAKMDDLSPKQKDLIKNLPNVQKAREESRDFFSKRGDTFSIVSQNLQDMVKAEYTKVENDYRNGLYLEHPDSRTLPDRWESIALTRRGHAEALAEAYKETIAEFDVDKYQKLLDDYFNVQVKAPDGSINWPETIDARAKFEAELAGTPEGQGLAESLEIIEQRRNPLQKEFRRDMQALAEMEYPFGTNATTAFQRTHPEADLMMWRWFGGALQTATAVDDALAQQKQYPMPVKLEGYKIRIDTHQELWNLSKQRIVAYEALEKVADRQRVLEQYPGTNAMMVFWGRTDRLHSNAAAQEMANLAQYVGFKDWAGLGSFIVNYYALPTNSDKNPDKEDARLRYPNLDAALAVYWKYLYGTAPIFFTPEARSIYGQYTGEDITRLPVLSR